MITFLRIFLGILIVVGIPLAAFLFVPVQRTEPQTMMAANWEPVEGVGEYAMRLADCSACHTSEGGERFAGGRPIESPVGTIHSSNITPDPETGIGGWGLDEFRAALYDGVRPDGTHLYPAMPYANYRKLDERDVRALYHFFTEEVEPVRAKIPENDLAFPFDQRWGLRAWKWVALGEAGFTSSSTNLRLERGEYLVEGPGHCGACHSPRNLVMAQAALSASDEAFLSGGEIAGWTAPPLRGPGSALAGWSSEDIVAILGTGRNAHSAVNGEMRLVVQESTQYMNTYDLNAIAAFLTGLNEETGEGDREVRTDTEQLLVSADPQMPIGPRLYLDNCNACHFSDGLGADEVFPELDGNTLVAAESPKGLVSMILEGSELPSTAKRPYSLRMPGFGDRLSDEEVAELASFVRSGWSNDAEPVTPERVAEVRAEPEPK